LAQPLAKLEFTEYRVFTSYSQARESTPTVRAKSDNRRFTDELLTVLTDREMAEVETYWSIVLGLE
jgi:hypothetical protein